VRARLLALGAATAALGAPASAAAANEPLLPDLRPVALTQGVNVGVYAEGDRRFLDVGFRIANLGAGPLELAPLPEPASAADPAADCDGDGDPANDRPERQNVYLDADSNGEFDRDIDSDYDERAGGCSVFHPGHSHWHAAVLDTDVIALDGGVRAGGLDKLTFCLVDYSPFNSGLPGFDPDGFYGFPGCNPTDPQGISVGWYDQYVLGLAGQQIDVTNMAAGTYCVRQTVDSSASIDELDETNNVAETRVQIDPAPPSLAVLSGSCELGSEPPTIDTTAPDTQLLRAPTQRRLTSRRALRAQFGFGASEAEARFECSLDDAAFVECASPAELRLRARRGVWTRHSFAVRAVDPAGNADGSPAMWTGKVKRRR
jgi:hypothetical protein